MTFRDFLLAWVMPTGDWITDLSHLLAGVTVIVSAAFAVWKTLGVVWHKTAEIRRLYSLKHQRWLETGVARAMSKIDIVMRINNNAVYVCTPQGANVMVTEALAELFGLTPEEMAGNGWSAAISCSSERTRAVNHWHECVKNRIPYDDEYEVEVRGQRFRVGTTAHAVVNSMSDVLFYTGWVWVISPPSRSPVPPAS
jgi:PAS domain-containing protein